MTRILLLLLCKLLSEGLLTWVSFCTIRSKSGAHNGRGSNVEIVLKCVHVELPQKGLLPGQLVGVSQEPFGLAFLLLRDRELLQIWMKT